MNLLIVLIVLTVLMWIMIIGIGQQQCSLNRTLIWNQLELQGLPTPIFASNTELLSLLQNYGQQH